MLLRTRITLIVSISFLVLSGGLVLGSNKLEQLADERYADATLTGQETVWRKIVENLTQGLGTAMPAVSNDPAILTETASRDRAALLSSLKPIFLSLKRSLEISRLEVAGSDGEVLYSSQAAVFPTPILDAGLVARVIRDGAVLRGVQEDASRNISAAVAFPLRRGEDIVGTATYAIDLQPALAEFKRSTAANCFVVDRTGKAVAGTDPALWQSIAALPIESGRKLKTFTRSGHTYLIAALPIHNISGRLVAHLITLTDATESQRQRKLVGQIALATTIGFLAIILFGLYGYLQRSFAPLDEAIDVLKALSRGDTTVNIESERGEDEIGRIAETVEIFREHAVALDRVSAQRERQRRRQERLIRRQMLGLAETLDEAERAAVLADLATIEAAGQAGQDQSGAKQNISGNGGELAVLAVAMETMAQRVSGQHRRLAELVAERTRDLETVREALRQREQLAALRQELDFARQLQLSSLPQEFPPFPDRHEFALHASMVPAKEVGGDFYDYFFIDEDTLGLVIGDASGKGVSAAMFIATARSLIKATALRHATPGEVLRQVNDMLAVDNPTVMFATVFFATLNLRTGDLCYGNAGHNPPYIVGRDGAIEMVPTTGDMALGVMEQLDYDTATVTLPPGGLLVSFTDGVTEATDTEGRLFTETRLLDVLRADGSHTPDRIIAEVHAAIEQFVTTAPQADDITMLALRYLGPTPA